ncbi:MAG TPA: Spy/CpxP family protein refolding chaperone [Fimbriimonadaceae bacterium]|nr:Spy/CpxP family protein refolding chaperone [Fimbriimonadaceae bacterium]
MRKHHWIRIAVIAASLFVAACASAETLLERNAQLIASPNVAEDLKLTDAQLTERNKLFEAFQTFRSETVTKMQALPQDKQEAMAAEIESHRIDLDRKLVTLLTETQSNRLMQIGIQQEGFVALQDDLVAKQVGLTPAQRAKIKTICDTVMKAQDEYQAAVGEALGKIPEPTGSDDASIKAYEAKQQAVLKSMKPQENKFLAAKESARKQIYTLMTPAQRTKWGAIQGKPLKVA